MNVCKDSSPPVSAGDTFKDLPQMPKTVDSSKPYIYIYIYKSFVVYIHTYDKVSLINYAQ
jgi:hypothetical protein